MILTRHARNRIRFIRRTAPDVSAMGIVSAISEGQALEPDPQGRRRVRIEVAGIGLTAVISADGEVLITLWKE